MLNYANPTRFMRFSEKTLPFLIGLTGITLAIGLYMSFFTAPPDYQQGDTVRIMFIHVPFAWLAMATYTIITLSSIGVIVWRHPLADVSAKTAAPLGALFTFLALFTGSVWGKPMWGTWWVWDARLTSVLILFFLYLGLMALRNAIEEEGLASRLTAILSIVGFVIIPIIKFSVDWWNTLHQPASVIRLDGPKIDISILVPLLVMALGFTLLFVTLHMMAMRNEILRRRIQSMMRIAASNPQSDRLDEVTI